MCINRGTSPPISESNFFKVGSVQTPKPQLLVELCPVVLLNTRLCAFEKSDNVLKLIFQAPIILMKEITLA